MKKIILFRLLLVMTLLGGCMGKRSIAGNNESSDDNILKIKGVTSESFAPTDSVFMKSNFLGYDSISTDLLVPIPIISETGEIIWNGRLPYGSDDCRFFVKHSNGSWDFLNSQGIYAKQGGNPPIDLDHLMIIENDHINGHPIAWGIATEFTNNPGGINPLEPTETIDLSIEYTGIPNLTYNANGQLIELPDSTVVAFTENNGNHGIWTQNTNTSFLPHEMQNSGINHVMTCKVPKTGDFSFLVRQDDGSPLLMGINVITSYGWCEAMNVYDYYTGTGSNIVHFLVYIVHLADGIPNNVEFIDYRFGNWWTIGITNGKSQPTTPTPLITSTDVELIRPSYVIPTDLEKIKIDKNFSRRRK